MSATRKTKPDTSGPREADFYPTPAWAVEAVADLMLASRPKDMPVIYEPGAGDGAILRTLLASGVSPDSLRGCEIRDDAAQLCRADGLMVWTCDFLRRSARAPRATRPVHPNHRPRDVAVLVVGTPEPARVEVGDAVLGCYLVPIGSP